DLHRCVEDALGVCTQAASAKGLELVCDFLPGAPDWVRGDVTRLRQVLVNLVGNAVKFTESGEVLVTVSTGGGNEAGTVKISVRDTGIGIDPERISRLFKPFSQADSSTTRRYGGSGLGLAICKRLVELMGGRIAVDSTAGKGSDFHFTIRAPQAQPEGAPVESKPFGGLTALVVEDNAASRAALAHQLARWEMRVVESGDAVQAVARLHAGERFDVCLVDMTLREIHGVELARRMRAIVDSKKLPLILLTQVNAPDAALHAKAAGMQATVNKPLRHSQLREVITRALEDSGRLEKQAAPNGSVPGTLAVKLGESFPLSILIAEDFPVNQRIASLMLKKIGYTPDIVPTGKAAVDAVREGSYDLVLMDMHMPEMDGIEATREIRRLETETGHPGIYIIALTADAMAGDREKCISAGMNDYLTKPLRSADLQGALQRFVQN
ncbi:MAG TPA: response regulator, partial [Chthoniobacteraceae bacterium]|nr:response regulator [Chthoniobacteraceae bacterium]